MAKIGHDTEAMRNWASTIQGFADTYNDDIEALYKLVDNFVQTDFTGGLSSEFNSNVLSKRNDFNKMFDNTYQFAEEVLNNASNIDSDTEEEVSRIRNT